MQEIRNRSFTNGIVYALKLADGAPIEVTDTFLPAYTKNCINEKTNELKDYKVGSRDERWMIGVSTMSGCPVRCKFCATGKLKKWRKLTAAEIVAQVEFILAKNPNQDPTKSVEFKINYTRMGEPMLNLEAVKEAISIISKKYPNTHHYVSTIGIKGMDTSWVKGNITLQVSLHSLDEARRNELIPFPRKMTIEELGQIRTESNLKTTVNMTLVDTADFDINKLRAAFDPAKFFIKLSPINVNETSEKNGMGAGVIKTVNLI
jgi:23S rRNA (adenine2503-C2)-methyltransferase